MTMTRKIALIAIGGNARNSENGGIAIGGNSNVGGTITFGTVGGIAIGSGAVLTNWGGQTYNAGIVIGNSSSESHQVGGTNAKHGIKIGNSITETINTGNFLGGNIFLTLQGNSITNAQNLIVIDTQSDTGGSGRTYSASDVNAIKIGNPDHTKVQIGAMNFTKPTVTGSRGGNAALASLLTQLATIGLIVDGTTA